jgi:hypothetical protein
VTARHRYLSRYSSASLPVCSFIALASLMPKLPSVLVHSPAH